TTAPGRPREDRRASLRALPLRSREPGRSHQSAYRPVALSVKKPARTIPSSVSSVTSRFHGVGASLIERIASADNELTSAGPLVARRRKPPCLFFTGESSSTAAMASSHALSKVCPGVEDPFDPLRDAACSVACPEIAALEPACLVSAASGDPESCAY